MLGTLEQARARAAVIVLALVLVTPSIATGFSADDYLLLNGADEPGSHGWTGSSPFDLFRWTDARHTPLMMDGHGMAWWVYPATRIAFMRPVSSLFHAIDLWLWPHSALAMHVHSLIWFAALLSIAAIAYAALIDDRWVAGVATAMFAVDSAHGFPVGWISNRNALLGALLGIASLLLHNRRRRGAAPPIAMVAWACFALGLLSCELALGTAGSLLAYELFLARGSRYERLRSLLPYAVIVGIWGVARAALGYGVVGLGSYIDPVQEPIAFAEQLPTRAMVLLSSQIWRFWSDLVNVVPLKWQAPLIAFDALLFALGAWLIWRSRVPRTSLFWASSALLCVLPIAAGAPSERLLLLVGFAVPPLVAQAMHSGLQAVGRMSDAAVRRAFAWVLAGLHLGVDPISLPLAALVPAALANVTETAAASLPDDPQLNRKTVIVAAVPNSIFVTYLMTIRAHEGRPRPARFHWLTATSTPTRLERRGPAWLRVTSPDGVFSEHWEERSERMPLRSGERIELGEMTVTVVDVTADGRPSVCDIHFTQPLESPHYVWLTWRDQRLVPLQLPGEGGVVTL